jgi:hypothetical protein
MSRRQRKRELLTSTAGPSTGGNTGSRDVSNRRDASNSKDAINSGDYNKSWDPKNANRRDTNNRRVTGNFCQSVVLKCVLSLKN